MPDIIWPQLLIPPAVGAVVGYFTNDLAVRMLFHPLEAKYIFGKKVPMTPGLVPAEQERLADRIARLIVDTLLTEEDFKALAARLLTTERMEHVVGLSVDVVLAEFAQTEKLHAFADDISGALTDVIQRSVPALTEHLAEKSLTPERIRQLLDQVIEGVIENFHVTPKLAQFLSSRLLETVLTPENLRQSLVAVMTPSNIQAMDELARERLTGRYGVLLFFLNLPEVMGKIRTFLDEDPEEARYLLQEIMEMMDLEDSIHQAILRFNPREMSWENISDFKESLVHWLHQYLSSHYDTIVPLLVQRVDLPTLVQDMVRRFNPEDVPLSTIRRIKEEGSRFGHRYLDENLYGLVEKALEMADLHTLIANKIRSFPPARMEAIILEVSRRELNMIVWFGGFLGFLIGCIQAGLLILF